MRICLLGGTAFLGRRIALTALDRGHQVTCLARGSTPPPDGVEFVAADRDDDAALAPLSGRTWDAVVDLTRQPGQARRAVRDVRARHRVLVSSGNVYARFDTPEQDEDADLLDPLDGDAMASPQDYGPAKVACERAYRSGDAPVTIARVGLIGGDGDATGRSGYWPWRFAHPVGDGVVVPGDPDFPCAMVDVADLAGWLLEAAEAGLDGVFNVTGPTMTLAAALRTAADVAGSSAPTVQVPPAELTEAGARPWMGPDSLPLWIDDPDWRYFATMNTGRARAAGLVTRPFAETLAAALAFEEGRGGPPGAGLSAETERTLLDRFG